MVVADTKMEDSSKAKEEEKKAEEKKDAATTPPTPPLEAAARRLERLLGGGLSEKDRHLYSYTNPAKVVRRWLGSASGAAGKATSADIAAAAMTLLDSSNICGPGRALLLEVCDNPATADSTADMEIDGSGDSTETETEKKENYLSMASSREVETWLLSLQIRLLWKEEKFADAMTLVEKGIAMVLNHLDIASQKMTSAAGVSMSSLFPLLARLYRYRSLVADAVKDPNTTLYLRKEMSKAHNMACLRRDFDSQATLLNLMLRDLLQHSQSKCRVVVEFHYTHFRLSSYPLDHTTSALTTDYS
jgi:hypothetical protein